MASLVGHSDFVKSVTVLPTSPATLISTSSDKSFRLWDLSPLEIREAPTFKQAIKEHTRPVDAAASAVEDGALTVWTADSMGVLKQWHIPLVSMILCDTNVECGRADEIRQRSRWTRDEHCPTGANRGRSLEW